MALTANWFFEVAVAGGQTIRAGGEQSPETVDVAHVEVDAGAAEAVDLLPASADGTVSLLVIRPSEFHADVAFSFEGPAGTPETFALDGPVVLIGSGSVSLLPAPPLKLWLTNDTPDPVTVEILIGRDATP